MRFTYEEAKQELLNDWEQITSSPYPEDLVHEYADSALPIYYNEILADWTELPREYEDRWLDDMPITKDTTIYSLMSYDLYNYYRELYQKAYDEILEETE